MMGVSIAWAEQILPWIVVAPIAFAVLALIHLWSRREPDSWPVHDTRRGDDQ